MNKEPENPRVTVLLPSYNAERYLGQSVESILHQTFTDFEFLIIDDGSTDGAVEILRRYAKQDPRIRLILRENRGLVATLNEGLEKARAPLLARMDNDDEAVPDRLEKQVAFLDVHPEVMCVASAFTFMDESWRLLTTLYPPEHDEDLQKLCLAGHCPICDPASMFRREAALAAGGFNPELELAQDLDMWLRLGEMGKLACIQEPLLRYRLHTGSLSGLKPDLQRDRMRRSCEEAWQRRGIEGRFEAEGEWRPSSARASRHHFAMRYGWWAFGSGHAKTAALYGLKAVRARPWHPDGYRLLACALLKRPSPESDIPEAP